MTLLIGINLLEFAMIGADTRVNQGPTRWEDGYQKIKIVPTGLIAGAGLSEVHDEVEAAWRENRVASNQEISATASAACERRRGRYAPVNGCDLVDLTQFIMTMQGAEPESPLFLNVWHPERPDTLLPIVQNRGFPIMPVDASTSDEKQLYDRLGREVRPLRRGDDLEESVRYHTRLIGQIVASVAAKSVYVSESYSVGVHFREPHVARISEIKNTSDGFLRWAT